MSYLISQSTTLNSPLQGPTLVRHPQNKPIHIKLSKTFAVTGSTQYFIIGSNNITIEGCKNSDIIVSYSDGYNLPYPGLIRNGTNGNFPPVLDPEVICAFDNLIVKHIRINTAVSINNPLLVSLKNNHGWIGQQYFGIGAKNVIIKECINNAIISNNCGGIVGNNSTCILMKCVNNGIIGGASGGCVGSDANGTRAFKCKNMATATISGGSGGIFGANSVGCSAKRCKNEATINGNQSGGIFGIGLSGIHMNNATGCKNSGIIQGRNAGGIFGGSQDTSSAYKCYNTSNALFGNGIFGGGASRCIAEACFNTGTISKDYGGIFGNSFNCTAQNCYYSGTPLPTNAYGIIGSIFMGDDIGNVVDHCYVSSSLQVATNNPISAPLSGIVITKDVSGTAEATGIWKDRKANKYLIGTDGSIWIRRRRNQPYKLNI